MYTKFQIIEFLMSYYIHMDAKSIDDYHERLTKSIQSSMSLVKQDIKYRDTLKLLQDIYNANGKMVPYCEDRLLQACKVLRD